MPNDERENRSHPRKRFGQHFLSDRGVLTRIADALNASPGETVIEIGPGRGALTDLLVARGLHIIAIEIDRDLTQVLRERYAQNPGVRIVEGDVLTVELAGEAGGLFRLIGNIPYNITTPIVFHALKHPRPLTAVFLVQREVAERMAAPPGSRIYGALSVNVQSLMQVELIGRVKAGAFHPPPKVESAIVRLTPLARPVVESDDEEDLREFVIAAFGQRRKQMLRVVRQITSLEPDLAAALLLETGIESTRRPETLTPADFAALLLAVRRLERTRRAKD